MFSALSSVFWQAVFCEEFVGRESGKFLGAGATHAKESF
jgi:hypothetical protein